MISPCTQRQKIFTGIAVAGVVTGGIAVWQLFEGLKQSFTKIREMDECCPYRPGANCTNDPQAYCVTLKKELSFLDNVLTCLFLYSVVALLGGVSYLLVSSCDTLAIVFKMIQNYRIRKNY